MEMTLKELAVQIDSDKPTTIYIHALADNDVVGMLRLEIDEPAGYIGACFIKPEYRAKGLGTRLIERACELSREHGFETIGLSVNKENQGARDLYARLGFMTYLRGHNDYIQLVKFL